MAKEAENKAVSSSGSASPNEQSGAPGKDEEAPAKSATSKDADTTGEDQDAVALLKADHRKVEGLFQQYESARNSAAKQRLVNQIAREFLTHSRIEEEIFYPACREKIEDDLLDEAQVEHDSGKLLVRELCAGSPGDPYYDAKVTVLSEYVKHHVGEEEKSGSGIFDAARKAGVDLAALGKEIMDRKEEIMRRIDEERPAMPSFSSGKGNNRKEYAMAQQDYMDRDRRRSRSDDDDDYRGRRTPPRDEEGRFMSDDRRSRSSRDYDDDDDRGRGRGRGQGGWFGDPEGHSEASRLGWEHRDSGRSSRYEDDDRYRRSSSSREDDDDRRGSSYRGRGRDDDRGQGGWFGDPEGHSEASRRGWENREGGSRSSGRYEDDDRGRYGRGRDDDDGRGRYSRGRDDDDDRGHGRGGWFGDPRGHSEAARRGWQNR